jgi:hypothetical protein
MKAIRIIERLFEKVNNSELPLWVKVTLVISLFLTLLIDTLSPYLLISQITHLIKQLLELL